MRTLTLSDSPASDTEWLIVEQDEWWTTDWAAVSWDFDSSSLPRTQLTLGDKKEKSKGKPPPCFAKPPYYQCRSANLTHHGRRFRDNTNSHNHNKLATSSSPSFLPRRTPLPSDDLSLNISLPGVQAALDVLKAYESDSGFNYDPFPLLTSHDLGLEQTPDIGTAIRRDVVEGGRKMWGWAVRQLFLSRLPSREEEFDFSTYRQKWALLALSRDDRRDEGGKMHRSTSTMSSIDFTESDVFSMPATPKAKSPDTELRIVSSSPPTTTSSYLFSSPSPARPLNASASSFVPSFSFTKPKKDEEKEKEGVFNGEFSFASLNPLPVPVQTPVAPMVKIKKDDQGFFTEVHVEASSSTASTRSSVSPSPPSSANNTLLPPFLQEPTKRKSRTRQIVDKLRSQSQSSSQNGSGRSTPAISSFAPSPAPFPSPSVLLAGKEKEKEKETEQLFFPEKKHTHSPSPSHDFSFLARPRPRSVNEDPIRSYVLYDELGRPLSVPVPGRSSVSTPANSNSYPASSSSGLTGLGLDKEKLERAQDKDKDEGWIAFDDGNGNGKEKEKRKGLLHVLSRRRTDSLGSAGVEISASVSPDSVSSSRSSHSSGYSGRDSATISPASTPPSSSPACNDDNDDGWIEGSVLPPPSAKRKTSISVSPSFRPSSGSSASANTPLFPSLALYPPSMNTHLPLPTPPLTSPSALPSQYGGSYFYPYNAAAGHYGTGAGVRAMHMPRPVHGMQMQMQVPSVQMQMQMFSQVLGHGHGQGKGKVPT